MLKVKYVGSVLDSSGYAAAARNYIVALNKTGQVDLTVGVASFEQVKTSHGPLQQEVTSLINKQIIPDIQIIHLTPENFPSWKLNNCYNIGYTVWETDTLPDKWVPLCNSMDEIWVPSDWNVEVFKNSGVTVPIFCVPHGFSLPPEQPLTNAKLPIPDDCYAFYSIFQWIERKAPLHLLTAYFTEFRPEENVVLLIKSYRLNTSQKEQAAIREQVKMVKQSTNLHSFPKLLFFGDLLTAEEMDALHRRGDCFVLPSRAEGFSICHAEALTYKNPVIGTNYSGNLQFMNKENSLLVDAHKTPTMGMLFNNYHAGMNWSHPHIDDLKKCMRWAYEHQEEAKEMALRGLQLISEEFSWEAIGRLILNRLKAIQSSRGA